MLFDKLLILMTFLDTRVLIFLLSLTSDTLSLKHVVVDITSHVFLHNTNFFKFGSLELLLGGTLALCFLVTTLGLLLLFLFNATFLLFVNFLGLLDELLKTLGELGAGLVFISRLNSGISVLLSSSTDNALDGSEIIIESI